MAIFITIFFLLAIYHLILESIVLPMLRTRQTYKLMALKDQLINLKIELGRKLPQEDYEDLRLFITAMAHSYSDLNLLEMVYISRNKVRRLEGSKEISISRLADHSIPEVRSIFNAAMKATMKGFLINFFGWIIYLLPIVIVAALLLLILHGYKKVKYLFYYSNGNRQAVVVIAEQQMQCERIQANENSPIFSNIRKHGRASWSHR